MNDIAFLMRSQWKFKEPYSIPLTLRITFFMPVPARFKDKLHGLPHISRPDIDNLEKICLDCLVKAGNIIKDDRFISELHAIKLYDSHPRTEIEITPF